MGETVVRADALTKYSGRQRGIIGLDAGHAAILLVATGAILGLAVLAFERRDRHA